MVDHLPSTINLYKTLCSQGTGTMAVKPVGPFFIRMERDHCSKKKIKKGERLKICEVALARTYLIKGSGDDGLIGVVWPAKRRKK